MADTYISRGAFNYTDFDKDDFTKNEQWHMLTLPGFVPSNAKRVRILGLIRSSDANDLLELSEFPQPGFNVWYLRAKTTNPLKQNEHTMDIDIAANKEIAYWIRDNAITMLNFYIKGWWV